MKKDLTGGQVLAASLEALGTKRVFCVAGESYLAFLDAVLDIPKIEVITCRHESGAGFMAESYGKMTGLPGICFVTRGPGICNASIAIHTAQQDSTPLIVFMGQVQRHEKGREAFQEVSVEQIFGSVAKWATEIEDPASIPEIARQAFEISMSGRPGPVVIALPEDMLREETEIAIGALNANIQKQAADRDDIKKVVEATSSAQSPMMIVGGAGWSKEGIDALQVFAEKADLPVATALRRSDLFNGNHSCYIGEFNFATNPALIERIKEADLVIALGTRLGEITTQGYSILDVPKPKQKLIHIYGEKEELGKVYDADIAVHADPDMFIRALAEEEVKGSWADWRKSARDDYEAWNAIDKTSLHDWDGADLTAIYAYLQEHLPKDAIVTTDAGNFSGWAQRFLRYGRPGRLLAPLSGAMGYAVPSAISASIENPDKVVLGLCGDGGFLMTANDLATAIHHGAKPVIMVCNNNMYGTIRMHQERDYPGRQSATDLTNPDFVAYAKSFGVFGARVEHADEFEKIWQDALAAGTAAVIEIKMDPRQITSRAHP